MLVAALIRDSCEGFDCSATVAVEEEEEEEISSGCCCDDDDGQASNSVGSVANNNGS